MDNTLEEISREKFYMTDKGKYINNILSKPGLNIWELYDLFFKQYKEKEINFLEFGFGADGDCLRTFAEYFSNAKHIIGVDYEPKFVNGIKFEDPRIKTHQADQHDLNSMNNLADKFRKENIKFDIIVEDAAHTPLGIRNSILSFFDLLNEGGLFVIEGTYMLIGELNNGKHNILTELQIAANEDTNKWPWKAICQEVQSVYTCRGITVIRKGPHMTNL